MTGVYSTGIALGCTLPFAIILPIILPITNSPQGVFFISSIPAMVAALLCWFGIGEQRGTAAQGQGAGRRSMAIYRILRDRNLWLVAFMLFALCIHFYVWILWAPALMMLKGASPELASLMASVRGWTTIPVIFLVPFLSYKVGLRKPFLVISPLILVLASIWAIYISLPWGWLLMVIVGMQSSGAFSMILALPAELVPEQEVGSASGMILSIGYIGGLIGPWLAGYLFDIFGTLDVGLMFLAGVAAAWTIISAIMPETGPGRQPKAEP